MALAPGTRIGTSEIVAALGAGISLGTTAITVASTGGTGTVAVNLTASDRPWTAAASARFDGVPSGVYWVRVRARNALGLGTPTTDIRLVVP